MKAPGASGSAKRPSRRNRATLGLLVGVVAGMTGLSFASVPLYRMFCAATGYGGTTQRAAAAPGTIDRGRIITVRFDAETAPDLGWEFRPLQGEVKVHPGEEATIAYRAINKTPLPVTGTASYNVTPQKIGLYFDKVQCFCFSEQHLEPGESADLGVSFFVDPEIARDPATRDVETITLSYTMFRSKTAAPSREAKPKPTAGDPPAALSPTADARAAADPRIIANRRIVD